MNHGPAANLYVPVQRMNTTFYFISKLLLFTYNADVLTWRQHGGINSLAFFNLFLDSGIIVYRRSRKGHYTCARRFNDTKRLAQLDERCNTIGFGAQFNDDRVGGNIKQLSIKKTSQFGQCTQMLGRFTQFARSGCQILLKRLVSDTLSTHSENHQFLLTHQSFLFLCRLCFRLHFR